MELRLMAVPELPPPAIDFTVYGVPAPKGSKSAFPVRRKDGSTGVAVREGKSDRQKDWTRRLHSTLDGYEGPLLEGPLRVTVNFFLPRPKSAPKSRRFPEVKPDIDKLARAVLDPMTGVIFRDDAQVVYLGVAKFYTKDKPRAQIYIEEAR